MDTMYNTDEKEVLNSVFPPEDEDPEEFTADVPEKNNEQLGTTISFDQLNQQEADQDQLQRDWASINPPRGDWEKEEDWELYPDKDNAIYVSFKDRQDRDINPLGRTYISLAGKAKERTDNLNNSHCPVFTLRISPDRRPHKEKPGQFDLAYTLYMEAAELYLTINGSKGKPGQIVKTLLNEPFIFEHINGNQGPFVWKIKQPKNLRRKRAS